MKKLKIINIGSLPFLEDEDIVENKDYLLSIRCSLDEIRNKARHGEETAPIIYVLKADRIEQLMAIGDSKPLTLRPGKTKSQILRWKLEELARLQGKDEEIMYEEIMNKNIELVESKIDELRN